MILISMHNTGINVKWQKGGIFALLCCCWCIDPGGGCSTNGRGVVVVKP